MEQPTEIQKIYEQIPNSVCKDGCADCCFDMIQVAPEESERMGGYEWIGQCIHLKDNRCTVHANRPFVCRLYGASELLPCKDCTPQRFLTPAETKKLADEYAKIKNQQEADIASNF